MVELLDNQTIKGHFKDAVECIESNDPESALVACAKAHYYVVKPMSVLVPSLGHEWVSVFRQMDEPGKPFGQLARVLSDVHGRTRSLALTTALGIPLVDYLRCMHLLPSASKYGSGDFQVQLRPVRYGLDDATFALRFLVDYALAVERAVAAIPGNEQEQLWGV